MSNLKVFTAFSGYDSQMLALKKLGIDAELVGWSEIDKYAIKAHNVLFPEYSNNNFGDIIYKSSIIYNHIARIYEYLGEKCCFYVIDDYVENEVIPEFPKKKNIAEL